MEQNNIDVTFMHEAWLVGDFIKIINDHRVVHHGLDKVCSSRGERGVATTTPPTEVEAHETKSEESPLAPSSGSVVDSGRVVSINVELNIRFKRKSGAFRKNKIKNFVLNIALASNYYPVEPREYKQMVDCTADRVLDWPKEN